MKYSLTTLLLSITIILSAQHHSSDPDWTTLMGNPNTNFSEVSALHQQKWAEREVTPGCGFKPFKRWEWLMSQRLTNSGLLPTGTQTVALWKQLKLYNAGRSPEGNWQQLGPILDGVTTRDQIPGVGRTTSIAFHPSDPNIILLGTPAGGLWRSMDAGASWTTNTDGLPTLGVSSIAFDPADPSIVYMGTGDRDAYDAPSMGVMKSLDGGDSWEFANNGIEDLTIGALRVLPGNVVVVATNAGIHRSADGGLTWAQTSANSANYRDLDVHPTNPLILYATGSGKFYRSVDGGLDWEWINEGISSGTRMVIAVSPATPDVVYVLAAYTYDFKAFYKSTDAGLNFVEMSNAPNILGWAADGSSEGGQAWYDLCMEADREVADVVYVGGIRLKKTIDGGVTWLDINPNYLHVDQHELVVSPHNSDVYLANDGGVYQYVDNAEWLDISAGLINGQIYQLGQSKLNPNATLTGFQDNGTMEFSGAFWDRTGGGDGFESAYDNYDSQWRYGSIYYGDLFRTGPEFVNQKFCGFEVNDITETGAWNTPYILSQFNDSTMFVGLKNVWRSTNIKHAEVDSIKWDKISNNLAFNNIGDLNELEQCMSNEKILYAAEPNRKLFITHDALADSVIWVTLTDNLPMDNAPINGIETHPADTNIVYIAFANDVWKSVDQGVNWTNLSETLPDINISSIVMDTTGGPEALYIGTDMGIYYKDGTMSEWISFSQNLPINARVTELEIYYGPTPAENRIKAATYGRGLWESDMFGSETTTFPAVALLTQATPTNEVYNNFEVNLAFYRALQNVPVTDLTESDFYITNADIVAINGGPLQFTIELQPTQFGQIDIYIPDASVVDAELIPNYHSDTLSLFYIEAPEPFGYLGPAGVGDLETLTLWLRSDMQALDAQNNPVTTDSTKVAVWEDVSGNGYFAQQNTSAQRPLLRTGENGINGQPALYFDGDNDALIANGVVPGRSISAYIMVEADSIDFNDHGWFASAREPNGYLLHPWKDEPRYSAEVFDLNENYMGSPTYYIGDAAAPHIYGFIYHQDDIHQVFTTVFDDKSEPFPAADIGDRDNSTAININIGWDHEERFGKGKIAEHFVFSERLYSTQHNLVINYMAAKYGLDLGPLSRYHHPMQNLEVMGIGREAEYDYHNDAKGKGIVRISSPSSLDAADYLMIGEDSAPLEFTSDMWPIVTPRLIRTWGYTETNDVGEVIVRIDNDMVPDMSGLGLIISPSDEFISGEAVQFIPLTVNGLFLEAEVDFDGSGVFTIGTLPEVGVQDYALTAVTVFPNPAEEVLNIHFDNAWPAQWQVHVFDALGQLVTTRTFSGKNAQLDMQPLPHGIYTLSIAIGDEWNRVLKVVKK